MRWFICLILLVTSHSLLASNRERLEEAAFSPYLQQANGGLVRKSQAVLTYLWVDVYAAALYTEPAISPQQAVGHHYRQRLELYYFRKIARADVIEAAWQTLERQHSPAQLARLRTEINALHDAFADIQAGDRYALNYSAATGLSLERNARILFSSPNAELAHAYLGIWLASDGLSQTLRQQLLSNP
jgi:hypothetical protein